MDERVPDTISVVTSQFEKAGIQAEYMRRDTDGTLRNASENELSTLKTQARLATAAQQLSQLSVEEKTWWALDKKDEGNELYAEGRFKEAMEKYVESLSATDFSGGDGSGNVDDLVMPVLCNLAACCINLGEYRKGVRFCDQALEMRPQFLKAHMRKGICHLNLGEFDAAVDSLKLAQKLSLDLMSAAVDDSSSGVTPINTGRSSDRGGEESDQRDGNSTGTEAGVDEPSGGTQAPSSSSSLPPEVAEQVTKLQRKIQSLLVKATKGLRIQKESQMAQKRALQRAFGGPANRAAAAATGSRDGTASEAAMDHSDNGSGSGIIGAIINTFVSLLRLVLEFFYWLFGRGRRAKEHSA